MSNIWYTSDLHIGHKLVSGHRGFHLPPVDETLPLEVNTAAHDEHIAREWDSIVRPDDQVFVLGDISINGSQHALDWIAARPGRKHLIAGNHDPVHPMRSQSEKLTPKWLEVFETISPFSIRKIGKQRFLLQHFPYWPHDRGEPRFEEFRLPDTGIPLLHGHTHSDEVFEFPNSFHVGWDAHGTLVPQHQVELWLNSL